MKAIFVPLTAYKPGDMGQRSLAATSMAFQHSLQQAAMNERMGRTAFGDEYGIGEEPFRPAPAGRIGNFN